MTTLTEKQKKICKRIISNYKQGRFWENQHRYYRADKYFDSSLIFFNALEEELDEPLIIEDKPLGLRSLISREMIYIED